MSELEQAVLDCINRRYTILEGDRCSQCYECLPCPEDINIPEVLRLRNLAVSFDMVEFGKYRYKMFENAGHWFPGRKAIRCTDCGDCLPRCPENLDIPKLYVTPTIACKVQKASAYGNNRKLALCTNFLLLVFGTIGYITQ